MLKRVLVIISLIASLVLTTKPYAASACLMATIDDYSAVTQDQKYKLVILLNPGGLGTESSTIRSIYSRSGLYRNDGSNSLIWAVDSEQTNREMGIGKLYASDDGKHLVRFDPLSSLTFYENGKLLKNYGADYFGAPTSLMCGTNWLKNETFDASQQRISVETNNSSKYEFDISSGNVISISKPDPQMLLWLFLFISTIVIPLVIILFFRRKAHAASPN